MGQKVKAGLTTNKVWKGVAGRPVEADISGGGASVSYDIYANLPAGSAAGDLAYATDREILYRWSGAAWVALPVASRGGATGGMGAAADYPEGSFYWDTTVDVLYQQVGGAWIAITTEASAIAVIDSANLRNSNDAEKQTSSDVYVKLKECKLNNDLAACTIKFDVFSDEAAGAGSWCYGRLYKNGVAFGDAGQRSDGDYQTKTESFAAANFVKNDLIQLWVRAYSAAVIAKVRNFRFYYDRGVSTIEGWALATPLALDAPAISMTNQDP